MPGRDEPVWPDPAERFTQRRAHQGQAEAGVRQHWRDVSIDQALVAAGAYRCDV